MLATDVTDEKRLTQFAGGYADEHLKAELLAFWGRHPGDKFTAGVISYAIDHPKLQVKRALKQLAEAGLVDTFTHGDLIFYNLTANETKRRSILQLSAMDQDSL